MNELDTSLTGGGGSLGAPEALGELLTISSVVSPISSPSGGPSAYSTGLNARPVINSLKGKIETVTKTRSANIAIITAVSQVLKLGGSIT